MLQSFWRAFIRNLTFGMNFNKMRVRFSLGCKIFYVNSVLLQCTSNSMLEVPKADHSLLQTVKQHTGHMIMLYPAEYFSSGCWFASRILIACRYCWNLTFVCSSQTSFLSSPDIINYQNINPSLHFIFISKADLNCHKTTFISQIVMADIQRW